METLVRDKIPELIEEYGPKQQTRIARPEEVMEFLLARFVTDAEELAESVGWALDTDGGKDAILWKMADLYEAIESMCTELNITPSQITNAKIYKAQTHGKLSQKVILIEDD